MNRAETTRYLSLLLQIYLNPHNDPRIYTAREVTFDYATGHSIRVDFMRFAPVNNSVSGIEKGDFYCYEVKSSVEDFHSKNGHNMIGDFNYYVMPLDVYEKISNEIPFRVGVYVPEDKGGLTESLRMIKKARRIDRSRCATEMLLMMFRSSNRDLVRGKNDVEQFAKDLMLNLDEDMSAYRSSGQALTDIYGWLESYLNDKTGYKMKSFF